MRRNAHRHFGRALAVSGCSADGAFLRVLESHRSRMRRSCCKACVAPQNEAKGHRNEPGIATSQARNGARLDPPMSRAWSTLWESMMGFQNQPTTLEGAGSNPAPAPDFGGAGNYQTSLPPCFPTRWRGGSEPSHTLPGSFRSGGVERPPPTHL